MLRDRLYNGIMGGYTRFMRERYSETAKQILLAIGVGGLVLATIAVAPGALQIAKLFEQKRFGRFKKQRRRNTTQTIKRLQKNNLFVVKEKKGKFIVELTKQGKQKLREMDRGKLQITKPAQWDRKWRVVIFDIPDRSFKQGRDALRGQLKRWEFYQLQKSVWVCPWPCEKEIRAVTSFHEILPYVKMIIADKILEDVSVRKHFGLPSA